MSDSKIRLKIWGILFVGLAVFDIVSEIIQLNSSAFKNAMESSSAIVSSTVMNIALYILVGISIIISLVKIYLGIAGYMQVIGRKNGKAHITIAKILRVFIVISAVLSIINFVAYHQTWDQAIIDVTSLLIIMDYIKCTTELYAVKE